MMTKCPECGSTDIVPDLIVFADAATSGQNPPYVKLVEPEPAKLPFIWMPKDVKAGFRAAICGACGHTQFYTKQHAEILEAHKKGYTNQTYGLKIIPNL
jgi:predicted nucleic-acid-binding Zn-ribbon protein